MAHIWLSGPDLHWQLGGLLGDFIKGPLPDTLTDSSGRSWPPAVRGGVRLHRLLDARVEQLEDYRACLQLLPASRRRIAGVALDVYFDYLLVHHWAAFCEQPLDQFSQRFYDFSAQQGGRLPARAERYLGRARDNHLFRGYGELTTYRQVLAAIEQRLRYPLDLRAAGDAVVARGAEIEHHFLQLLPELRRWADAQRQQETLLRSGQ
nr:ACP phosphodiesterase [Pseudomaricurvus sp. HS19]